MVMATKIKDGLFIGDVDASRDPEFIELYKITHVINCAGGQLPNFWEQHGLRYLALPWASDLKCNLFDDVNVFISKISTFIDEALDQGDSVLIHSLDGTGRCVACLAGYLMFRYRWGPQKALDFVSCKQPGATLSSSFVQQLHLLDWRLCEQRYGSGRNGPEKERIRHDQWVPLSPDRTKRLELGQEAKGCISGCRRSITPGGRGRSRAAVSTSTTSLPPGAFHGAPYHVQEEELMLVHSFLNSQLQVNVLPQGCAAYEDREPTELHWIDRPRMDKLAAAGRLGPDNKRTQFVPISLETGQPVPERPSNSSYNALSQESSLLAKNVPLIGILKVGGQKTCTRDSHGNLPNPSSSATPRSELRELRASSSGSGTTAVHCRSCREKDFEGTHAVGATSHEGRDRAKAEDEVVAEDLSDARPDVWENTTEILAIRKSRSENIIWEEDKPPHRKQDGDEQSSLQYGSRHTADVPTTCSRSFNKALNVLEADVRQIPRSMLTSAEAAGVQGDMRCSFEGTYDVQKEAIQNEKKDAACTLLESQGKSSKGDDSSDANGRGSQAWGGDMAAENMFLESNVEDLRSSNSGHHSRARQPSPGRNSDKATDVNLQCQNSPVPDHITQVTQEAPTKSEAVTCKANERSIAVNEISQESKGSEGNQNKVKIGTENLVAPQGGSARSVASCTRSEGSLAPNVSDFSNHLLQAPVSWTSPHGETNLLGLDPPGVGWREAESATDCTGRDAISGVADIAVSSLGARLGVVSREMPQKGACIAMGSGGTLQQLAQTPNPQQRRLPYHRMHQDHNQGPRRQPSPERSQASLRERIANLPSERLDPPRGQSHEHSWVGAQLPIATSISGASAATPLSRDTGTDSEECLVHVLASPGPLQSNEVDPTQRISVGRETFPARPIQATTAVGYYGSRYRGSGDLGSGEDHRGDPKGAHVVGEDLYSSLESVRFTRKGMEEEADAKGRRGGGNVTGRDQDNSTVLLRRDLRGSRVEISPADPTPRARGSCAPDSQTNERHSGGYHGVDSRGDMKSYSKQTRGSFSKQTEGTLPFPSRRNSSDNFVAASYDSERWANPAPPGRPRSTLDNSALSLSHAGFVDSRSGGRGSGGKGSAGRIGRSARAGNNGMNSKVASAHQPHASQRGSKPREGGVLSYRSGSPAPARGRRKGNASHISNSSPISRLSREQKVHEPPRHLQGSKIPPEVKGHIASTRRGVWVGGGDWGAGDSHGLSAPSRQNMPSTTTSRDRRRRERDDLQWEDARSALISNVRAGTPRQRPSTSEGLQNDGSEMRRRRSPTPAPRPSSASGRRSAIGASPASGSGSSVRQSRRPSLTTHQSMDRPRWK